MDWGLDSFIQWLRIQWQNMFPTIKPVGPAPQPVVVNVTPCEISLQSVSPSVFIPPQPPQPPPPPMPVVIPTNYYIAGSGIQVGNGATVTVVGDLS